MLMVKKRTKKTSSETGHSGAGRLLTQNAPFAVKEAYVKLRTNLMFCMTANGDRPCKVFAVTSAGPSEGKSTTAANVAVSCAMLGKKTLLIDADLRKPAQRRIWKVKRSTGLCDFLAKIHPLHFIKVEELPLWIVCAGTIPPNPSEILSSERMVTFVEKCSDYYDYLIIDTPPINTVADAQIISSYVDGVAVVARSGVTTADELQEAIETVKSAGGNFCGVIMNDLDLKSSKYGYRQGYYRYSYKYKYGYSDTYGSK